MNPDDTNTPDQDGCGCRVGGAERSGRAAGGSAAWMLLLAAYVLVRRGRRP